MPIKKIIWSHITITSLVSPQDLKKNSKRVQIQNIIASDFSPRSAGKHCFRLSNNVPTKRLFWHYIITITSLVCPLTLERNPRHFFFIWNSFEFFSKQSSEDKLGKWSWWYNFKIIFSHRTLLLSLSWTFIFSVLSERNFRPTFFCKGGIYSIKFSSSHDGRESLDIMKYF